MEEDFETWAIVEVMGHNEYAGFVRAVTVAGAAMLRIDVPKCDEIPAFTKYLSTGALYGITPTTEETATAKALSIRARPFAVWNLEKVFEDKMRSKGLLLESKLQNENDNDEFFGEDIEF